MPLGTPAHHEQTSGRELQAKGFEVLSMTVLEYKRPDLTETDGRYRRLWAEFWFVIAVESHAVVVVSVVIE